MQRVDGAPIELLVGDLHTDAFRSLRAAKIIACDIETSGLDPATERIGTVQVASATGPIYVVKVAHGEIPYHLASLMESSEVTKVFHFAPFDLAFMAGEWAVRAQNVACTKVMSRIIAGSRKSDHSLRGLLKRELDVEIDKSDVRVSDWTSDSLTPEQIKYAASDVAYLLPLYERLFDHAVKKGVARLVLESFAYLPTRAETDRRGVGDAFAY